MVRLVDKTGHTQYLATCPGSAPGITGGAQPYVDVDPLTPIQTAQPPRDRGRRDWLRVGAHRQPGADRPLGDHAGHQPSRRSTSSSPLAGQPLTPTVVDPTKYDLMRTYVDAKTRPGHPGDAPRSWPSTRWTSIRLLGRHRRERPAAEHRDVRVRRHDQRALGAECRRCPPAAAIGPQRIRSVRVRLVTRTAAGRSHAQRARAQPDGALHVPLLRNRDRLRPGERRDVLQYARARTVTAEVSLPNQSRNLLLMNALALAKDALAAPPRGGEAR